MKWVGELTKFAMQTYQNESIESCTLSCLVAKRKSAAGKCRGKEDRADVASDSVSALTLISVHSKTSLNVEISTNCIFSENGLT